MTTPEEDRRDTEKLYNKMTVGDLYDKISSVSACFPVGPKPHYLFQFFYALVNEQQASAPVLLFRISTGSVS